MLRPIGTPPIPSPRVLAAFTTRRLLSVLGRAARRAASGGLRGTRRVPEPGPSVQGHPRPPEAPDARAPQAVFIDARVPRPLEDSGSARVQALLGILVDLGLPTGFIADSFQGHDALHSLGLRLVDTTSVTDSKSAMQWLHAHRSSIKLVILARHTVAGHWLPAIRSLLPQARVIFDTVDLHHVRESREAEVRRSALLGRLARGTRGRELGLIRRCDRTWVVSETERQLLTSLLADTRVDVVSNVVDDRGGDVGFRQRTGFVFLGSFRHPPNIDALEWLASDIWPRIRQLEPDVTLDVIGPHMPLELATRLSSQPGVAVRGFVRELDQALHGYRVMLAPLRFGAGVKGKINSALACGLPVVATGCAVEGMHLRASGGALVADGSEQLALRSAELYRDPVLWSTVRDAGRQCLALHFSTVAARASVAQSLSLLDIGRGSEP